MARAAFRSFCVATCAAALLLGAGPAWASSPHQDVGNGNGGHKHGGGSSSSTTGIDVSYPQCGDSLPTDHAFAIVGLNGGLANNYSPCFQEQFIYASLLPGGTSQPVAQIYLNTADPGNSVADWPSPAYLGAYGIDHYGSNVTPAGVCDYADPAAASGPGANSAGCAYVYGYDMVLGIDTTTPTGGGEFVLGDAPYFESQFPGRSLADQPVWLDVETANSWMSDTAMNIAALQGMVEALDTTGPGPVGIYSTAYQWNLITGTPSDQASAGNLLGLPVWIPGARKESSALSNCTQTAFTGASTVTLTQWFGHPYDGDVVCPG